MLIFVKTVTGQTFSLQVSDSDICESVKDLLQDILRISKVQFRIYFGGRLLDNEKTLKDYLVKPNSILNFEWKYVSLTQGALLTICQGGVVVKPKLQVRSMK